MKETPQTLWFIGVAAATVLLAVFTQPSDATFDVDSLRGKPLTDVFEPELAKSLKIVKFDEETATLREFEVAEQDNVWTIPSQGGYPADAVEQMAEASTAVMDREILALASQSAADHEKYGVVGPSTSLEVGQTGVGTRVTLSKGDGSALVDLVIGKEVKDADDQRYVRRANQDVVFVVEIDPNSLSTKFEDWIEDDLLALSTFDISQVRIKDYTSELIQQGMRIGVSLDQRSDMTLAYDDSESAWVSKELLGFNMASKAFAPIELAEGEELNTEVLNDLKSALDDLRIIDVEKKPSGLSADLKAGEDFFENQASMLSLMGRGFAPTTNQEGEFEVLSTEGEVVCSLNNGVEYVLRFGNLQVSDDAESADVQGEASEGDDSRADLNRYLFVMARLNKAMIDSPDLEAVPELPAEESAEAMAEKTDELSEEAVSTEGEEDSPETTNEEQADNSLETLKAEREAIIDRNQRAQDEYADKIANAEERVEELNARFGDWYYVVSNEVFEKIRLGRDDVIKQSESDEDASASAQNPNVSQFGAPGDPVPGLPDLSGLGDSSETETDAAEE